MNNKIISKLNKNTNNTYIIISIINTHLRTEPLYQENFQSNVVDLKTYQQNQFADLDQCWFVLGYQILFTNC